MRAALVPLAHVSKVRELDAELVESGVKPSTRHGHQIVLRSIVGRFAVEREYLTEAPPFPKLPKCGRLIHTALSQDEVERLLAATDVAERCGEASFLRSPRRL